LFKKIINNRSAYMLTFSDLQSRCEFRDNEFIEVNSSEWGMAWEYEDPALNVHLLPMQ